MSDQDLERLVLRHVSRANYRPVKPRVIAKQLGISESQHQDLKRTIKQLAKRGDLRYGKNHLVEGARSSVPTKSSARFAATCRVRIRPSQGYEPSHRSSG